MITRLRELASIGIYDSARDCIVIKHCSLHLSEGIDRELQERGFIKCSGNSTNGYGVIISGEVMRNYNLRPSHAHE